MKNNQNSEDYKIAIAIKAKISRVLNVIISIVSMIVCIVTAFVYAAGHMKMTTAGMIIPGALLVYLVMGLLTLVYSNEKRKSVMIIYIVGISLCAIAFILTFIYAMAKQ